MDKSLGKLQELVRDREGWHGVAKSQTRLSDWTELDMCVHFVENHQALHLRVVYFHVFMLYANKMFKIFRIFLKSGFISPRIFFFFFFWSLLDTLSFFSIVYSIFQNFYPSSRHFYILLSENWFCNNKARYCHLLVNYHNKGIHYNVYQWVASTYMWCPPVRHNSPNQMW